MNFIEQVFYTRVIAEAYSLSYQDVNMSPPPIAVTVTLQQSHVYESTVGITFGVNVTVRKYPGVPTSAQVKTTLESFDKNDYLKYFVNRAEPQKLFTM